jgi:hypothetical protein
MNIIKKLIKYIIFILIIFSSIIFISKSKVTIEDSLVISLIGTTAFGIIDQYAPSYVIKNKKVRMNR